MIALAVVVLVSYVVGSVVFSRWRKNTHSYPHRPAYVTTTTMSFELTAVSLALWTIVH